MTRSRGHRSRRRTRRYFLRGAFLTSVALLGASAGAAIARKISDLRGLDRLDSGFDMMTGAMIGLVTGVILSALFAFKLRSHSLIKGIIWTTAGFIGVFSFLAATRTEQPVYQVRDAEPIEFLGLPFDKDKPARDAAGTPSDPVPDNDPPAAEIP